MSEAIGTKRTYKDSLFRMVFRDKEALLSLYNAINGTQQEPDHCIGTNILKDFLNRHRAEVKNVILTEYDEKRHEKSLREEGEARGFEKGIEKGIPQGEVKRSREIAADMLRDGMPPEKVKKYVRLSEEQWTGLLKSLSL